MEKRVHAEISKKDRRGRRENKNEQI